VLRATNKIAQIGAESLVNNAIYQIKGKGENWKNQPDELQIEKNK